MLVCDVSAIDRLIDMYGENLSVFYNNNEYRLYDLRDQFVDNNKECSLDNYLVTANDIRNKNNNQIFISINPSQDISRDDIIL